ncbi:MAG: RagB/SusD family nutrient uptake outer membrane protein [Chitinophagaceae bacterium]|nr:RagB/SusD family nutrient uptake outer membrane protein [Chitinophagaceae bacterium]
MNKETKKIIKTILFILALPVVITSCKRDFLAIQPQGQLTETAVAKDPNIAKKLVTGVYNQLYQGGFGNDIHGIIYCFATDVASDDANKGSTKDDQAPEGVGFDSFTTALNSNNFYVNRLWNGHYQGISTANQALVALDKSTFDHVTKRTLIGEVKFLRAYLYFNLVRLFGGVPLVLRVPNGVADANDPAFQTRASKDSVYAAIISDLQYGVDSLPLKGDPGTQVGRATKGAAESLLAKVYLYLKNYQKAYDLTHDVIVSGKYSLISDYSLNFRNKAFDNNQESVFEIQAGEDANCDAAIPFYVVAQGPRVGGIGGWADLGFGLNTPTQNLVNAYEAGDKRLASTVIIIRPDSTVLWDGFVIPARNRVQNSFYNYKAYYGRLVDDFCVSGNTDHLPKNVHIVRYAEVLLINAEAAIQVGHAGDAVTDMGLVRSRAGLTATAVTQLSIWKERRVELAMEQDRFFDIVRQGRAGQILRPLGKAFVDGKNEVFPIPQPQIELSGGKLTQNPGY